MINETLMHLLLFLRDTPHSLGLLEDISNLWDKIVATSGQQLMESGERDMGLCYLPAFRLHSCFTDNQKTVSVVRCA